MLYPKVTKVTETVALAGPTNKFNIWIPSLVFFFLSSFSQTHKIGNVGIIANFIL